MALQEAMVEVIQVMCHEKWYNKVMGKKKDKKLRKVVLQRTMMPRSLKVLLSFCLVIIILSLLAAAVQRLFYQSQVTVNANNVFTGEPVGGAELEFVPTQCIGEDGSYQMEGCTGAFSVTTNKAGTAQVSADQFSDSFTVFVDDYFSVGPYRRSDEAASYVLALESGLTYEFDPRVGDLSLTLTPKQ